ncbi:MAG: DUF721 domain-containing protein [Saprospiraceae bacterium]|nr:DUF721 domain-containing protein [Candidatus Vicinibacter affinis]MBP6173213.1 DUF721 domain-containing protein [Saprospiraceae bacterium]MBK6572111.1 DUF721 domain-containing protein [Candidatus Vicinibacter affinis]MBK6823888.1 DUF721 domain-containing protein [Candidatus Vicinibacter affinis]MBK7305103.1 DUF721 domain-containing protein [Candidatus Vicinibacter affinis]
MKRTNDQKLADVLGDFANQELFKNKLIQKRIENIWFELFGSLSNGYTEKIIYRNKILSIYVNSSNLRADLSMNKKQILDKLNEHLKEDLILELNFR